MKIPSYSRDCFKRAASGYRGANNTAQSGALNNVGNNGLYWSATPNSAKCYCLNFNSTNVNPTNSNVRAFGFSVRPCKVSIRFQCC